MRFEHLAGGQDAPLSVINCILQDRTGFLWLGTQSGLNRYDGYRFQVYHPDPADPASLPHDLVLALAEDPSGDLWIGTEGGGLARWRRSSEAAASARARSSRSPITAFSGDPAAPLLWVKKEQLGNDFLMLAAFEQNYLNGKYKDPARQIAWDASFVDAIQEFAQNDPNIASVVQDVMAKMEGRQVSHQQQYEDDGANHECGS